jgi:hypothetical protein
MSRVNSPSSTQEHREIRLCWICAGPSCVTQRPMRHRCTTCTPVRVWRDLTRSPGHQILARLSLPARLFCHVPPCKHTATPQHHSHSLQTLQRPVDYIVQKCMKNSWQHLPSSGTSRPRNICVACLKTASTLLPTTSLSLSHLCRMTNICLGSLST